MICVREEGDRRRGGRGGTEEEERNGEEEEARGYKTQGPTDIIRRNSVGILISIFAKYLPGKMKIFRGNTEELVFGVSKHQFFLPYFISYTIVMHTIEDSLYR